jgi:hypothetical protein
MRLPLLAAGCFLVVGTPSSAQQKYDLFRMKLDDRAELVLDAMKDATKAVAAVKDKASAEVAKAVLESVDKRITQYSERETDRTPAERRWVADFFIPKRDTQQAELDKAIDAVTARDPKLLPLFLDSATLKEYRTSMERRAKLSAEKIVKACKTYYIMTNQKWPASLEDLAVPPKGKPFLEGGKSAILTPWGKPYQLSFEKNGTGMDVVVISAINPFGDGKEEIRWPPKEK